ncbi:hypothetical protein [Streptomyces sp. JV178]|uniref:hypothetical protein n=1 Tax=Streptomyces sp. JV178 TaxID=858632 RepID=UPI0015D541E4|nr:hypothetical protein [Streptomyces sp. JV178]
MGSEFAADVFDTVNVIVVPILLMLLVAALWVCRQVRNWNLKRRGKIPIEVREVRHAKEGDADLARKLGIEFSKYLAEDSPKPHLVQPPGEAGVSGLAASTHTPPETVQGVFSRWMFHRAAHMPAHAVQLEIVPSDKPCALSTQVMEMPRRRVEAVNFFEGERWRDVIADAGSFCLQEIRRSPLNARHTPRWERWSADLQGYRYYRDALEEAGKGKNEAAIEKLIEAESRESSNVHLRLLRAQLIEGMEGRLGEAIPIYRLCSEVWSQNIEARYRGIAARVNARDEPQEVLGDIKDIKNLLSRRSILWRWLKSHCPGRKHLGEAHYWLSWVMTWNRRNGDVITPFQNKRRIFLRAVEVMEQGVKLREGDVAALEEMGHLLKGRPGWMARYNAACIYAMQIDGQGGEVAKSYAAKALDNLGRVLRDPRAEFDTEWARVDPDLQPLKDSEAGEIWLKSYFGDPENKDHPVAS